jgi:hypothetical protein
VKLGAGAVSQSRRAHKDREERFSWGENHENVFRCLRFPARGTGPHFSPRLRAMESRRLMLLSGKCNRSGGALSPRFPVRLGGVNKLHAALPRESRTIDHGRCRAVGNSGSLTVFFLSFRQGWEATNLNAHRRGIPPFAKNAKDGAHPLFAALPALPNTTVSLLSSTLVRIPC